MKLSDGDEIEAVFYTRPGDETSVEYKSRTLVLNQLKLAHRIPKERRSELDETDRMQYAEIQIFFCYSSLALLSSDSVLARKSELKGHEGSAIL